VVDSLARHQLEAAAVGGRALAPVEQQPEPDRVHELHAAQVEQDRAPVRRLQRERRGELWTGRDVELAVDRDDDRISARLGEHLERAMPYGIRRRLCVGGHAPDSDRLSPGV
jgi:hypothetical protein